MDRDFQRRQLRFLLVCCCGGFIFHAVTCGSVPAATTPGHYLVPAVYVFGDSTVDVGNNNYLPNSTIVANFPPYGVDYPGGVSTGRFCNGYIVVDFLVQLLGFRESPPPALSVAANCAVLSSKESHGLNFGSGGSGILDSTDANVSISLSSQVDLFSKAVARLVATKGKPAADDVLSKSLYILSTASNDIFNYFAAAEQNPTGVPSPDAFLSSLVAAYRIQIQRMHALGARKFVFIGVGDIGCIPVLRAITGGGCVQELTFLAQTFNNATMKMLQRASRPGCGERLSGFKYSFTDTYDITSMIVAHPQQFGFTDLKSACCGSGSFNAEIGCEPYTTNFCSNRDQHAFWDSSHPTQATYTLIANYGFYGPPKFAFPVNIERLLQQRY